MNKLKQIIKEELRHMMEGRFDGNNLADSNSYYNVITKFPVYVLIGHKPSNAGQMLEPIWKHVLASVNDQIQNLAGGLFFVEKSGKAYTTSLKKPEFSPYEHKKDFNKFDLDKLEQVSKSEAIKIRRITGESRSISYVRKMIKEELLFMLEADGTEKTDKAKQDIEKQKNALDQKKLDFQKKQAATSDRESHQQEKEQDAADEEPSADGGGGGEDTAEPNLSFNTQGEFYKAAFVNLKNLQLSNGDLMTDDEKDYVSLAVQAAQGRFDGGFEKYLRNGKGGAIRGKDFGDVDINQILKYVKKNNIVR